MSAAECGRLYAYESNLAGEALIIANPGYVQIASIDAPAYFFSSNKYMTQAQLNTHNFLKGMYDNIGLGNANGLIARMESVPPSVFALISKDPVFFAHLVDMLKKLKNKNYSGINQLNFDRRATAASKVVGRALANAARENNARVQAANAARLQRTRNAAAAAARNVAAARNASTAAGANRAAKRAAQHAATASREANQTTGSAAEARAAAKAVRKANVNARAAARVAATRAALEEEQRKQAVFDAETDRWKENFARRRAQGRSVREVIRNMAKEHLNVAIPANGNIRREHLARIHPDSSTKHKALRTVLTAYLTAHP